MLAAATFAVISVPALAQMGHGAPVPMSPAEFAQANSGQSVQIEVRVRSVSRSTLDAELLARQTESVAKTTGKIVTIFFPDGTPVVMGAASDVSQGAILFVSGVLTKPGHVDAKRVVLVTKYVTVQ
jgi:hypothetical protein